MMLDSGLQASLPHSGWPSKGMNNQIIFAFMDKIYVFRYKCVCEFCVCIFMYKIICICMYVYIQ